MISCIMSRLIILFVGTLYPAYASNKAVSTKNAKECVRWIMYWIVFALYTCAETLTDVFLCWVPFYYEIKIILLIWLLSPITKGSSMLYRKFIYPALSAREQEIDECVTRVKEQSYNRVLDLGSTGITAMIEAALRNLNPMNSFSRASKSPKDQREGITTSQSAQHLSNGLFSDDDEIDVFEHPPAKVEKEKVAKSKGKSAVKKNRKTKKTDNNSE